MMTKNYEYTGQAMNKQEVNVTTGLTLRNRQTDRQRYWGVGGRYTESVV
jgi:hypothetical protein